MASKYNPSVRAAGSDSLCQGKAEHQLCDKCARLAPGQRTALHFLEPPAHNLSACGYFRSKR